MSSSSMALSLNLSMNSQSTTARSNSSSMSSSYGLNNNNPYLTNSLLRLFPNANPYNYSLPSNSNGNGLNLNKSSGSDRDRDRPHSSSPTNLSTTSGGDSSQRTTPNNYSFGQNSHIATSPLDIVDEIAYLYPHEDYTLLRQALMRNEVSLTKLRKASPDPTRAASKLTDNPTNLTSHGSRRKSPSPKSLPTSVLQQQGLPMDLIRQQNEYFKLLQQSGFTLPFPQSLASEISSSGFPSDSPNYPPWFHSLAAATALNLVGNPSAEQSGSSSKSSRKKPSNSNTAPTFATPKLPSSSYSSTLNSKPKTVAAALAASRLSPSSYRSNSSPYSEYNSKNKLSPRKRQRTKLPSMASRKSYSLDDDFVDPTSMLEVVTTPADAVMKDTTPQDAASSTNPLHFLNQLLIQSPGSKNIFPDLSMGKQLDNLAKSKPIFDTNGNGIDGINQQESQKAAAANDFSSSDATKNMVLHAFFHDNEVNGDARALARKFGLSGRVVMKWIKESTSRESRLAMNGMGNHMSPDTSPPKIISRVNGTGNGGSPPTNGDLNAAMAKYMNNFETASMNNRYFANSGATPANGGHTVQNRSLNNNETDSYLLPNASAKNLHKSNNLNSTSSSVNKRKNSKPNQICDPEEDDSFMDEPVDMIMANKRPHLSHAQQDT